MRARIETWVIFGIVAVLWAACSMLLVMPAGVLLSAVAGAGAKGVTQSLPVGVAVEAVVYLVASAVVFGLIRLASPPRLFWLAGPLGYVAGAGLWFGLTWFLGGEMTPEKGYAFAFAANVAATAVGAAFGLLWRRRPAGAASPQDGAGPASADATPEAGTE